jgi:hypothetical protein
VNTQFRLQFPEDLIPSGVQCLPGFSKCSFAVVEMPVEYHLLALSVRGKKNSICDPPGFRNKSLACTTLVSLVMRRLSGRKLEAKFEKVSCEI